MIEIIWQDSLSMIVKYIGVVDLIRDKREEHKYIYETFECEDINYLMFFSYHKYLFNVDLNHPKIRITLILIRKMVDKEMVCDKQECEWRQYLYIYFAKNR